MSRARACRNCGAPRVYAKGRCSACWKYWRRKKGQAERPPEAIALAARRRFEREQAGKLVRQIRTSAAR